MQMMSNSPSRSTSLEAEKDNVLERVAALAVSAWRVKQALSVAGAGAPPTVPAHANPPVRKPISAQKHR